MNKIEDKVLHALDHVLGIKTKQSSKICQTCRNEAADLSIVDSLRGVSCAPDDEIDYKIEQLRNYAIDAVGSAPANRMTVDQKTEASELLNRAGNKHTTRKKRASSSNAQAARLEIEKLMRQVAREILRHELLPASEIQGDDSKSRRLLGIAPGVNTAIVLPTYYYEPEQGDSLNRESQFESASDATNLRYEIIDLNKIEQAEGNDRSTKSFPPIADVMGKVHSRHDVVAAADLAAVQGVSALFTSAQKFAERFEKLPGKVMTFKDMHIDHFVFIGLFSNSATRSFVQPAGSGSFELVPDRSETIEEGSKPRIWPPLTFADADESGDRSVVVSDGFGDEVLSLSDAKPDRGLLARMHFRDATVSIVAGVNARATSRLADWIVQHPELVRKSDEQRPLWPESVEQLAEDETKNFILVLDTPSADSRFEPNDFKLVVDPVELPSYRDLRLEGIMKASKLASQTQLIPHR